MLIAVTDRDFSVSIMAFEVQEVSNERHVVALTDVSKDLAEEVNNFNVKQSKMNGGVCYYNKK